jgi:hypothetical protein|tara:strand:- start:371 stop:493 length:123 start_codon:yes stop_codon:yes gene_type:complete
MTSDKMTYDPNYQYNDEDEDDEMQGGDDDDGWGSDYIDDD